MPPSSPTSNRLDPAMQILLDNLDLLARRETRKLMALCGVDSEDLADMIGEIRALDPKPAATWDSSPRQLVVPDILMRAGPDGSWLIELNPRHHAARAGERALLCPRRAAGEEGGAGVPDRAPGQRQLAGALACSSAPRPSCGWRPRSCASRTAFCSHGVAHLRPLILRDIAEAVEMHESTVSRVTSNKYIATPRGTYELKYFFTTALHGTDGEEHSAEAVRHRIRGMIEAEGPEDVLVR